MKLAAFGGNAVLLLALTANACGYGNGDSKDPVPTDSCGEPLQTTIDTNAAPLEVDPGFGAGAFVEYAEGGNWHLFTACDTLTSGFACDWDIVVSALESGGLLSSATEDLETDDFVYRQSFESLRLLAFTGSDFDGLSFQTEPGAGVRVDALLDGACANRYLYWVGDGARHEGSPSSVLDLVPSAP